MNHFDILGIDPAASTAEIKKAFRRLSFQFHPDRNPSKVGKKRYAKILQAYQTLIDPVKKERYLTGQASEVSLNPLQSIEKYLTDIFKLPFML